MEYLETNAITLGSLELHGEAFPLVDGVLNYPDNGWTKPRPAG